MSRKCMKRMMLRGRNRGVSLMELSIVISIMGLLSVLSFPYWEEVLDSYRLKSAASLLASDLRLSRFEAVKSNCQVRVRILSDSGFVMEENTGDGWTGLRPAIDFSEKYFTRGAHISSGSDPVIFYPSGRAESVVSYSITLGARTPVQIDVSLSGMVQREG